MRLSDEGFYGPYRIVKRLTVYPTYTMDVCATVYGYESSDKIYEVVYLSRPVWESNLEIYVRKYYSIIGGPSSLEPTAIHKAIEKKFNLS